MHVDVLLGVISAYMFTIPAIVYLVDSFHYQ
jgi:hypothetical protein